MAINFDLYKQIVTDPTTASFAGAVTMFDYYGQKSEYKKKKKYMEWKQSVLEENKIAQENGVNFNNYLAQSVIAQNTREQELRQREVSAQKITQGAAIGQKGSAARLLARDAQFQSAKIIGGGAIKADQQAYKSQMQLDNLNLQFNNQMADLDFQIDNLESPSIFSSIVNAVDTTVKTVNQSVNQRKYDENILGGTDIKATDKRSLDIALGTEIK